MSSLQRPLALVAVALAACLSLSPSMSAISPEAAAIQLQMAQLLFSDGRYGEAFDTFEALKASDDPKIRRESLRGSVQTALRLGDFSHAFADVQVLMRNAGHDADAVTLYGDSLWAIGQFEEAEKQYQLGLGLVPLRNSVRLRSLPVHIVGELRRTRTGTFAPSGITHPANGADLNFQVVGRANSALGSYNSTTCARIPCEVFHVA